MLHWYVRARTAPDNHANSSWLLAGRLLWGFKPGQHGGSFGNSLIWRNLPCSCRIGRHFNSTMFRFLLFFRDLPVATKHSGHPWLNEVASTSTLCKWWAGNVSRNATQRYQNALHICVHGQKRQIPWIQRVWVLALDGCDRQIVRPVTC